jgi:hypothetical protein
MLSHSQKMLVNAPAPVVSAYLRDISRLAEYEPKVQTCRPEYPDAETATAEVEGRWFGLPWRGAFEMRFTSDGGFQSRMTRGPISELKSAFHVQKTNGGTIVVRSEAYSFPWFVRPFYPFLRNWLAQTIEVELRVVKEGAERLHRQQQLREIDGQAAV